MTQLIISLLLFLGVFGFAMIFMYQGKEFSSFHYVLYLVLLLAWTSMFMFKTNNHLSSKGFIAKNWWSWPVIVSLYQFTQVATRLPIGILSQKLKSRKEPMLMVMLILLIGLVLVISSNFADWAIVIGIICTGVMGATFGLNSQYWSENWQIKKGFISAMIVFTIPFVAQMFSKFINASFQKLTINLFWVTFAAMIILTFTFIFYAIKVKENKNTIFIDNMNPEAKPFKNKSMYDVMVISFSTALIVASFTFVTYIGTSVVSLSQSQKLIFPSIQIIFIILTPLLFLKFINIWNLSIISRVILFLASTMISLLLITNSLHEWSIILLVSLANASFGVFIGIMFSSTLHFDHKFPALVLGIFLTIKSFFTGSSLLASQLLVSKDVGLSLSSLGWIIFGSIFLFWGLSLIVSTHNIFFNKRTNTNKLLLNDSYKYERYW